MIGRLTGRIAFEDADGTAVIDVGGVGYDVLVPLGTLGRLRASSEGPVVTLFIHTHVREDVFALYGFATEHDRAAFRVLLAVSGVGPRIAVGVLSALPAGELAAAIARKEVGRLTAISGVGKKTAERLLLELRDKLPQSSTAPSLPTSPAGPVPVGKTRDLLVQALVRMGYRPGEADRAAAHLGDRLDGTAEAPLGELVREALLFLSK